MGPFRVAEDKRNVVVLESGDVWSMSCLVKVKGAHDSECPDSNTGMQANENDTNNTFTGVKHNRKRILKKPG